MLIEAHWKVVKHDYLYRFNRPRLDYVIYVLREKVLPDQEVRYNQLIANYINPHWWEEFKREWKLCCAKELSINEAERYFIDTNRWICSCPAFLRNLNISAGTNTIKEMQEINESDEETLVSFEEYVKHLEKHQNFLQHLQEEYQAGNLRHVKMLLNESKRVCDMMDDINHAQKKRNKMNVLNIKIFFNVTVPGESNGGENTAS
ncbi:hypothetical protein RclHR1_00430003 [Rhizophagus clarus]|uniref:Uncharacterized protein n=1 Tax=Rhizophagus clarus TaxID=94130 RepID=A0A2Z6RG57_9GLOM|nr:hypothetical protein RclHR1_00430003 [Rhizophagus clarus]